MAGGFASAYREEADLASYVVQDGKQVLVKHNNVAVQKAFDGAQEVRMRSPKARRCAGTLRRLSGWHIGASIVITGEVEHAGNYQSKTENA